MTSSVNVYLRSCRFAQHLVSALLLSLSATSLQGAEPPSPYEPYASLIGEWDVAPEGQAPQMVQRFAWAGKQSYMTVSGASIANGVETPHLEGVLMWDGVEHKLSMLAMLDLSPAARIMEKGHLYRDANGVFVREITASYSEGIPTQAGGRVGWQGLTGHFRQTFTVLAPGRMRTSVMRQTAAGWVPTFPGSDNLIMTKRS